MKAGLQRLGAGVQVQVGLGVKRLSARQNRFEVFHGLLAGRHGAQVTLGGDTCHVVLGRGAQPYGGAFVQQQAKAGRVGHHPARRGQHHVGLLADGILYCAVLVATVSAYTVKGLNLAYAAASQGLNALTELNKRVTQGVGQALPQGGLARATQANEGNAGAGLVAAVPQRLGRS